MIFFFSMSKIFFLPYFSQFECNVVGSLDFIAFDFGDGVSEATHFCYRSIRCDPFRIARVHFFPSWFNWFQIYLISLKLLSIISAKLDGGVNNCKRQSNIWTSWTQKKRLGERSERKEKKKTQMERKRKQCQFYYLLRIQQFCEMK